jgi:hypothetical protein
MNYEMKCDAKNKKMNENLRGSDRENRERERGN